MELLLALAAAALLLPRACLAQVGALTVSQAEEMERQMQNKYQQAAQAAQAGQIATSTQPPGKEQLSSGMTWASSTAASGGVLSVRLGLFTDTVIVGPEDAAIPEPGELLRLALGPTAARSMKCGEEACPAFLACQGSPEGVQACALPPTLGLRNNAKWTHVFRLPNMHVDGEGTVFNKTLVVARPTCGSKREPRVYSPGSAVVVEVPRPVLSLIPGGQPPPPLEAGTGISPPLPPPLYYALTHIAPALLETAPLLRSLPGLALVLLCPHMRALVELGKDLVGIPVEDLLESGGITCVEENQLLLAHDLLLPLPQPCGAPSPTLLQQLRRRYYLPENGLPLLAPGWDPHPPPTPLDLVEMGTLPPDWVVVLHASGLNASWEAPMLTKMKVLFDAGRVHYIGVGSPFLQVKQLLNRAALLVAEEGDSSLALVVLMPRNSSVLGVTSGSSRRLGTASFRGRCAWCKALADGCSLRYLHANQDLAEVAGDAAVASDPNLEAYRMLRLVATALGLRSGPGEPGAGSGAGAGGNGTDSTVAKSNWIPQSSFYTDVGTPVPNPKRAAQEEISREGSEMVPPPPTSLAVSLLRSNMKTVLLNFYERVRPPDTVSLNCHGETCPSFGNCTEKGYPDVSACWNPHLDDPEYVNRPPPKNCPKLWKKDIWDDKGSDPKCSHKQDYVWNTKTATQVFKIRNVYVNADGLVFNESVLFHRDGCNTKLTGDYFAGKMDVRHLKRAFNLAYRQGTGFYHGLIESMPQYYVLAPFFRAMPTVPILSTRGQWEVYEQLFRPIIGVPLWSMKRLSITTRELYFVEELYLPLYQQCGTPSISVWHEMRQQVMLPPGGMPAFTRTWERRLNPEETARRRTGYIPKDWLLVLLRRPGVKRSIVQTRELEARMRTLVAPEKFIVFNGSLPITQAKALFRRTAFVVGGHGAAMSNMIFMPRNSSLLEIRPKFYPNACYNALAYVCNVHYYLTFGNGTSKSQVEIDVDSVFDLIKKIFSSLSLP